MQYHSIPHSCQPLPNTASYGYSQLLSSLLCDNVMCIHNWLGMITCTVFPRLNTPSNNKWRPLLYVPSAVYKVCVSNKCQASNKHWVIGLGMARSNSGAYLWVSQNAGMYDGSAIRFSSHISPYAPVYTIAMNIAGFLMPVLTLAL